MTKRMRKYGAGAAVLGAVAGAVSLTLPASPAAHGGSTMSRQFATTADGADGRTDRTWLPITRNLAMSPERLLPRTVSPSNPVRVLSTHLDRDGRPVVTVRTATNRAAAAALVNEGQQAPGAIGVELDAPVSAASNDSLRSLQWDLDRLRTDEAWRRSTGAGITVAVVDSGVDAAHPDLAGQILPGADFITGQEGVAIDPHGHGTHVAGTIAALAGNGAGIAGLAPNARILPVRVLGDNGSGYMSDVADGIVYAADRGAHVINLSISSTVQVSAVSNAVAYARGKGVVVVAAAGNARRSGNPASYPAADEGVIAVAATDSADTVAG
jgi:subtilisin family serine protease